MTSIKENMTSRPMELMSTRERETGEQFARETRSRRSRGGRPPSKQHSSLLQTLHRFTTPDCQSQLSHFAILKPRPLTQTSCSHEVVSNHFLCGTARTCVQVFVRYGCLAPGCLRRLSDGCREVPVETGTSGGMGEKGGSYRCSAVTTARTTEGSGMTISRASFSQSERHK